jgi:hypothetical protein
MVEILSSAWVTFVQAIFGILGTWFLAFGLKTVKEAKEFDTSNPQPLSWRCWLGLILLTISMFPPILSQLVKLF